MFRNRSRRSSSKHLFHSSRVALTAIEQLENRLMLSGTWGNPLSFSANPNLLSQMSLMSDGSVMISSTDASGIATNAWYKLTPNNGSYASGSFSTAPSMTNSREYFASSVLPNGKFFVVGGENTNGGNVADNTPSIYDPRNTSAGWQEGSTWVAPGLTPSTTPAIADSMSETLSDGTVLVAEGPKESRSIVYNPAADNWSVGATLLNGDTNAEENWTKLPDGSILSPNLFWPSTGSNPPPGAGTTVTTFRRYIPGSTPGQGQWIDAGSSGVILENSIGEIGPGVLLPDGRVFFMGATGHTALYTPPTTPLGMGQWQPGPDFPVIDPNSPTVRWAVDDTPVAVEPNGDVLIAAGHSDSITTNAKFFEYTPDTHGGAGTLTDVTPTNISLTSLRPDQFRMLVLPTGEILTQIGGGLVIYQYAGYQAYSAPAGAVTPTISSVVPTSANIAFLTLNGTGLNGTSEGATLGDDGQMASNYPIVQIKDGSGNVNFAGGTFNWSSSGVQTGNLPVSTEFEDYGSLAFPFSVSAAGVSSNTDLLVHLDPNYQSVALKAVGSQIEVDSPPTNPTYTAVYPLSSFTHVIVAADAAGSGGYSLSIDPALPAGLVSLDVQVGTDPNAVHVTTNGISDSSGPIVSYSSSVLSDLLVAQSASQATLSVDNGAAPSGGITYDLQLPDGGNGVTLQASGSQTQLVSGSTTLASFSTAAVNKLMIAGGSGNDTLTLTAAGGNPIPTGGLSFDGGLGSNTLKAEMSNNEVASVSRGSLTYGGLPVKFNAESLVLDVNGGSFTPSTDIGTALAAVTLNVNSGSTTFPTQLNQSLASLNIASGTTVQMQHTTTPDTDSLYLLNLTLASSGTLDLNNSGMYLLYAPGVDPASTIYGWVKNGYNGGLWTGHGIDSSAAAVDPGQRTAIGSADSADGVVAGQPIDTIELKYTLYGDANLDGTVTNADLAIVEANMNTFNRTWDSGDFNFDGQCNSADLQYLLYNYGLNVNNE